MTEDTSICLLCGEPAELSIHDIWTDGDFQLSTCCTGLLEEVSAEIDADPAWGRALLCHLGAEELTGHVLRRVSDGQGSSPVRDFKLRLAPVFFSTARAFIARHHRHCGPPHVIWTVKALLILYLPRSRNERWPMCLSGTSHLVVCGRSALGWIPRKSRHKRLTVEEIEAKNSKLVIYLIRSNV